MDKPEDVPQDIWDAAVHGIHDSWDNPPLVLARVIMAERDRCKDIALSNAHADCEVAEQIAAMIEGTAIRKGEA